MSWVYLVHFDRPYKHARHYLGFTSRTLGARLAEHEDGKGARLMQVIREAGIGFVLARVWRRATRTDERRLKRFKSTCTRLCPICREGAAPKKWRRPKKKH
jgi:predicted GIY-YIG superfamily endonuclease